MYIKLSIYYKSLLVHLRATRATKTEIEPARCAHLFVEHQHSSTFLILHSLHNHLQNCEKKIHLSIYEVIDYMSNFRRRKMIISQKEFAMTFVYDCQSRQRCQLRSRERPSGPTDATHLNSSFPSPPLQRHWFHGSRDGTSFNERIDTEKTFGNRYSPLGTFLLDETDARHFHFGSFVRRRYENLISFFRSGHTV